MTDKAELTSLQAYCRELETRIGTLERSAASGQMDRDARLRSQIELLRKLTAELRPSAAVTPAGRMIAAVLARFARPVAATGDADRTVDELRRLAQALIMSGSR